VNKDVRRSAPAGVDLWSNQQQKRREERAIEARDGERTTMYSFTGFTDKNKKPGQFGSGAHSFENSAKCLGEITRRTHTCVETTGTKHVGGNTHRDSDYREHALARQESVRGSARPRGL